MIDYQMALHMAQTVLSPLQQSFLQQMGKEAAEALVNRIKQFRTQIAAFIASAQPDSANAALPLESDNQDPEELAAQILLAAKRDQEAFADILRQFSSIKTALDGARSTGDISANASGGSVVNQTVILGGTFPFNDRNQFHGALNPSSAEPLCSESAKALLKAAASADGQIAKAMDYDAIMKAGAFVIPPGASARAVAQWDAALNELIGLNFIERLSLSRGELYQVTHRGYEFLDEIPG